MPVGRKRAFIKSRLSLFRWCVSPSDGHGFVVRKGHCRKHPRQAYSLRQRRKPGEPTVETVSLCQSSEGIDGQLYQYYKERFKDLLTFKDLGCPVVTEQHLNGCSLCKTTLCCSGTAVNLGVTEILLFSVQTWSWWSQRR